jgi:hypothetical protein
MLAADGEDTFPFLDQPEPTLRSGSSTISQLQPACISTVTAPGWPLMPAPASCSRSSLRAASSRLSGPSSSRCGPPAGARHRCHDRSRVSQALCAALAADANLTITVNSAPGAVTTWPPVIFA